MKGYDKKVVKRTIPNNNQPTKVIEKKQQLNSYAKLYTFLKRMVVPKGTPKEGQSHTCLKGGYIDGNGIFNIENENLATFYELYAKCLDDGLDDNLNFVERPTHISMFLIDIDTTRSSDGRSYDMDDVKNIVNIVFNTVREQFEIQDENVIALLAEKPKPTLNAEKQVYKDGFHLYFPYIILPYEYRAYVHQKVKEHFIHSNELAHMLEEGVSEFNDLFDVSILKSNGMVMYGSHKGATDKANKYQITKLFQYQAPDEDENEDENEDEDDVDVKNNIDLIEVDTSHFSTIDLLHFTSNRRYSNDADALRVLSYLVDTPNERNKFDQLIMNTMYAGGMIKDNDKHKKTSVVKTTQMNKSVKIQEEEDHTFIPLEVRERIELAREFLKVLAPKRYNKYPEWKSVCCALYSIHRSLYNDWIEFSKKIEKGYNEKMTEDLWAWCGSNFKADTASIGISALHKWAKTDNPKQYLAIMILRCKHDIIKYAHCPSQHWTFAKIFHKLYEHEFVCFKKANRCTWYYYANHRWNKDESGDCISHKVSEDFATVFQKVSGLQKIDHDEKRKKVAATAEDDDDVIDDAIVYDEAEEDRKRFSQIITKLKNETYKSSLIKSISTKFNNALLGELLDSKTYLLGFNNGVFDLREPFGSGFRDGVPEDYVTLTTGYDFPIHYNLNHPDVKWVEGFIAQVQTEEAMRTYLMNTFCTYLKGGTSEETMNIWTGIGANGKSKTMELFSYALGSYATPGPVSFLISKRKDSESASPFLASTRGLRLVVFQEPPENSKLSVDIIKENVGGDWIIARPLFEPPFKFKPQYKWVLVCNELPATSGSDGGTWRRLRVVPWQSEFIFLDENGRIVKGPQKGKLPKPNQFKREKVEPELLKQNAPALMYLLLSKYFKDHENCAEPAKVVAHSEAYQSDNDIISRFISSQLRRVPEEKRNVDGKPIFTKKSDLISKFKTWVASNVDKHFKLITQAKLVETVINHFELDINTHVTRNNILFIEEIPDDDDFGDFGQEPPQEDIPDEVIEDMDMDIDREEE